MLNIFNRIEKSELGIYPTPIERLKNEEKYLNFEHKIYIKRDDLSGIGPGGNKVRSLEFILGDAVSNESDLIIASGPLQSNLCTLAASSCAKLSLECVLVHNGDKPNFLEGNTLLNHILGVRSHFIGNCGQQERDEYVNNIYDEYIKKGRKPYIIKNGATTGLGALGYINAVDEILVQSNKENLNIKNIFAPGGNGGVASGLIYGNALLGFPFSIYIISVEYDRSVLLENIINTIAEIEDITNLKLDCKISEFSKIIDDYKGLGWGIDTCKSRNVVYDFAKREGIFLENIYNSKVMVGLEDYVKNKKIDSNVCYVHTGGFGSLFMQFNK